MLIEFSVANYLSFKEKVTLSMLASPSTELEESNVFTFGKARLVTSAAVYGANASGKSNLIGAMSFMQQFVIGSSKEYQINEEIGVQPFLLHTSTENQPSFFEIVFIADGIQYRYGFEVDKKNIHTEWLFYTPKSKEIKLFTRENTIFDIARTFKEGKGLEERTQDNALFLSVVAAFKGSQISRQILKWFRTLITFVRLNDAVLLQVTLKTLLENRDIHIHQQIKQFISQFDLGFNDFRVKEKLSLLRQISNGLSENPIETKDIIAYTPHKKFDDKGKYISDVEFLLEVNESEGTKKIIALSILLLSILKAGFVLVVDELDARLHHLLTRQIIKLFNSPATNRKGAQLIFTTHDTTLLDSKLFRPDQIWFTEKDKYGASDLYSLVEYKGIHEKPSYGKDYILGKYGAIPFIGNVQELLGGNNES